MLYLQSLYVKYYLCTYSQFIFIDNVYTHYFYRLEKGFSFRLAALLGLSAIIRSNGLISLGFIVYKGMRVIGKGKLIIHVHIYP